MASHVYYGGHDGQKKDGCSELGKRLVLSLRDSIARWAVI